MHVIYIYKQKNCETFIYTKSLTFRKKQVNFRYIFIHKSHDTLHYAILHENVQVSINIQKALHFPFRDVLIYKELPYTKIWTLCVTRFFIEFLKLAEGGTCFKRKRKFTLHYSFIFKKLCTLRYVYISKSYRIVLIHNYKCTYNQSDHIEK